MEQYNNLSNNQPLVSVIVLYYNVGLLLTKSIQSILAQTYTNFELILLDHCSTDNTREIAFSFDDPRIIHKSLNENTLGGGADTFLCMLRVSQGKYLKTFCADDIMLANCLEKQVQYLENHSEIGFCSVNAEHIDENDSLLNYETKTKITDRIEIIKRMFKGQQCFLYPTIMARRNIIQEGMLDAVLVQCFDTSLWISLILTSKYAHINETLIQYRVHKNQMSGKLAEKENPAIFNRLQFEQHYIYEYFCKYFTTTMVGEVFGVNIDKKILPTFLCLELLKLDDRYKNFALNKLYHEFQDEETRMLSKSELGFGIRELRIAISNYDLSENISAKVALKVLKKKIKNKLQLVANRFFAKN